MTPEERAEKICKRLKCCDSDGLLVTHHDFIASEINQAVEEALEAERDSCLHSRTMEVRGAARAAYEEAAKVAADHAKIKGPHLHGPTFEFCVQQVANEIRALKDFA